MIGKMCELSPLPVNIMVMPDTPSPKKMAELGVARISYGPGPYRHSNGILKREKQRRHLIINRSV